MNSNKLGSDDFIAVDFTSDSVTVAANSSGTATISDFAKDGYTPLMAVPKYSSSSGVLAQGCNLSTSAGTLTVPVRNTTSSSLTITYTVRVLYVKDTTS